MRQNSLLFFMTGVLTVLSLVSCSNDGPHKPVAAPATTPHSSGEVSYAELQPVFQKSCTPCHQFHSDYSAIAPLASQGRESRAFKYVIEKSPKEMPPSGTPQSAGISEEDRRKIGQWILAGAPRIQASKGSEPSAAIGTGASETKTPSSNASPLFQKLQGCWACHGNDGVSAAAPTPHLAGLETDYLAAQLTKFRSGERVDPVMNGIAKELSEKEIQFFAHYFSFYPALTPVTETVVQPLSADLSQQQKVCLGCHTANSPVKAPRIYAQRPEYLEKQLLAYRSGERKSEYMEPIAKTLSDADIKALAKWYSENSAR